MAGEEHRPPPDVAEQTRAGFIEQLARELLAGADSPTPGSLLVTASTLLSIAAGDSDPSTTTATLVRGLSAWNRPECSAGALAMATLVGDRGLRREVRRDAADRGHLLPGWLVELHRAEPVVRAVELSTVFRDVDELVVGVTVPGGHCLTATVRADNELGFRVVDGRVSARSVDAVVAATVGGGDPDVRVRDIAPADARARLADALRDPDLDVLSGRSTPWRQLRPLVGWLVSVLPDGGDASVPGLWDDVDLDDVVAGFLASQWGRPWVRGGLPELVEAVLGDGLGNGLGDPLLWALHHVARLLDHESSALDHDELDTARTPELLRDVIRYGHAERGLPPRAHGRRAGRGGPPQRPLPRRRPRLARRRGMTTSPVGCVSRGVPEDTRLPCSHLWTTSTRSLVRAPEFPTMSTRPHPTVPVTDDVELTERWRALLQLDGPPSRRRLFLAWLRRDGTMVPLLMPVDDVPLEPDRLSLGNLAAVHATVAETEDVDPGDLHLALLLERHGPAGLSPDDHAWCSAVEALLRDRAGLDCSMHIGNGRTAVPVLQRRSWPLP